MVYVGMLIWLVLFKLTFHISTILAHQHRTLNLIPFAAPSMVDGRMNYGEMVLNCLFFIPFGLLLSVNFKKVGFWPKLAVIGAFSFTAELIQYVFAIGVTDITDLLMNTLGGFIGLTLYSLSNRFVKDAPLDRFIFSMGILLFVLFIALHGSHFFLRHSV